MSRIRIYARNAMANWIGFGANVVVTFFLTPFVVHSLGDTRYGTWSLLVSMVGYLGVMDVGVRASLGRFVNYYQGKGDPDSANAIISTAVVFFVVCGLVALVAGGVIALALPALFPKIPAHLLGESRISLLLISAAVGANFISVVFLVVLQSCERFGLINAIMMLGLGLRAGLTVWVLLSGYGLGALAAVQLGATVLQATLGGLTSRKVWPVLKIRRRLASWLRFREIIAFSVWTFIGVCVWQLLGLADMVIITNVISPAAVTFYSLGLMFRQRAGDVVSQAGRVTVPELQRLCAREDFHGVRWMVLRSANMNVVLFIGLLGGIVFLGDDFVCLWMGSGYESVYNVAVILLAGAVGAVAVGPGATVGAALNKVRIRACLSIAALVLNVGCSLGLVYGFGLGVEGVALGTTISMWLLFPLHLGLLLRWTHMPLRDYLRQAVLWLAMAGVYAGVCFLADRLPLPETWLGFLGRVAIALAAYVPVAWRLGLNAEDRQRVLDRFRRSGKLKP